MALHVSERRRTRGAGGRQLLDRPTGEPRKIFHRPAERGKDRPSGLVGERDGDLGPAGERPQERPLRSGQVLESVGEDRPAVPSVELVLDPLDGMAPLEIDLRATLREAAREVLDGTSAAIVSARFHNTLIAATTEMVREIVLSRTYQLATQSAPQTLCTHATPPTMHSRGLDVGPEENSHGTQPRRSHWPRDWA